MPGTRGRLSTAALISVGVFALSTASSAQASGCRGAGATTAAASAAKLRAAVLCLVNKQRAAHGVGALRVNKRLQRAAGNHARDMQKHHYFDHQRPGGPDLTARLDRVGWHGHAWG